MRQVIFEISLNDLDRLILSSYHYPYTENFRWMELIDYKPRAIVERKEYLDGILVRAGHGADRHKLYEPKENREPIEMALLSVDNFQKQILETDLPYLLSTLRMCLQFEVDYDLIARQTLVGGRYGFITTYRLAKNFDVPNSTVIRHMNRLTGLVSYNLCEIPYYKSKRRISIKKRHWKRRFYYIPFARRDTVFELLEKTNQIQNRAEFLKGIVPAPNPQKILTDYL